MKNFESESRFFEREVDGECESFVPDRTSRSRMVSLSGEAAVGFEPENGVGL